MESLYEMFDSMTESFHPHKDFTNKFMHTKYISLETSADDNFTMHSKECVRWEYDTTEFETTFVTEVHVYITFLFLQKCSYENFT